MFGIRYSSKYKKKAEALNLDLNFSNKYVSVLEWFLFSYRFLKRSSRRVWFREKTDTFFYQFRVLDFMFTFHMKYCCCCTQNYIILHKKSGIFFLLTSLAFFFYCVSFEISSKKKFYVFFFLSCCMPVSWCDISFDER